MQLRQKLAHSGSWKVLRNMHISISGRRLVQHPPLDEFATSLLGNPAPLSQPAVLTEPCFTLEELRAAILGLKPNKGNDDAGLVPELLQYVCSGWFSL